MKSLLLCNIVLFILYSGGIHATENQNLTLVTQNLNRFFDDKPDGKNEKILSSKKYKQRLNQVIEKIRKTYKLADIIAFQEIENIKILREISARLRTRHHINYQEVLIEGNDQSGIDVGFLVKNNYRIIKSKALFKDKSYNKNRDELFSRPPLLIEVCQSKCFVIVNVHLRSMRGLRSSKKGQRVAMKRRLQAETIAKWVDRYQKQNPLVRLIIAGDFNALTPSDPYVDSFGTILGEPNQTKPRWKSRDLVSQDLIDITLRVPKKWRYSYLYKKKKQQLDYFLINENLADSIKSVDFTSIDYSFSDHAGVIAQFKH